ncbi:hypothetical protein GCM10027405_30640 [Arthrobacter alkaliphilus]
MPVCVGRDADPCEQLRAELEADLVYGLCRRVPRHTLGSMPCLSESLRHETGAPPDKKVPPDWGRTRGQAHCTNLPWIIQHSCVSASFQTGVRASRLGRG